MQIPNDWEFTQLDQIALKVMVGIASAATHAYTDTGIRLLRNLNIKEGWIDDSDILHINEEYEKQHKNKRLREGDILTVRTGYPGISAVVPKQYEGAQCFTSLITRLDKQKALPEYVCAFINSEYGKRFIVSGEAGGAQKNVNAGMLKHMPVPLPPFPEQKKIVAILSTWDDAITANEDLLANSRLRKKALMQQLLTGKKRLPGFGGEWTTGLLSDICVIKKGGALSSKDLVSGPYPVIAGGQSSPYKHNSFNFENIITVSASGAYAGFVAHHPNRIWASDCSVVSPIETSCVDYIYQAMLERQNHIYSLQSGGAQPHIYPRDLQTVKIGTPPLKEQIAISRVLTIADEEIEALEQRINNLKLQKKALMQQLLTGKKRVKVKPVTA